MAAQVPDRILYNQEYFSLCTNPLEMYWSTLRKRRPRFSVREDCRRGYIATWEIRDNQLFLLEIDGFVNRLFTLWGKPEVHYSMRKLFGQRKKVVKAMWFSGKLRIPVGHMILYADKGYDARYAKEILVTVTSGNVDRVVTLDKANHKLIVNEGVATTR